MLKKGFLKNTEGKPDDARRQKQQLTALLVAKSSECLPSGHRHPKEDKHPARFLTEPQPLCVCQGTPGELGAARYARILSQEVL